MLPQDLQLRLHEEEEEPLGRRGVQDGPGRQAESRPGQRLRQALAAAGAAHAAAATASAAPSAAAPSALLRVKFYSQGKTPFAAKKVYANGSGHIVVAKMGGRGEKEVGKKGECLSALLPSLDPPFPQ